MPTALVAHLVAAPAGPSSWWLPVASGAVPAAAYLLGVMRLRRTAGRRWSNWRTSSFLVGTVAVALAVSPVVERAAAATASGHMAQHLLLGMYAPLGLVLGAPVSLLLGAVPVRSRRRLRALLGSLPVRIPSHLAAASALNVVGLYVLYLTPLYALSTRADAVHRLTHIHFLVAGCLFTWAVAGPDPTPHRAALRWRVTAVILSAGAHAFLAKLLYSRASGWPPGAGLPEREVEQAAQLMYYGGHLAELLLLVALFGTWYRRAPRLRPARTATRPLAGVETG